MCHENVSKIRIWLCDTRSLPQISLEYSLIIQRQTTGSDSNTVSFEVHFLLSSKQQQRKV